jgi:tetratricopeptide (TPR) repeat protein
MVKQPDRPKVTPGTLNPSVTRPGFAPVGGGTVGLPQSATQMRATVQVPGTTPPAGRPQRPMPQAAPRPPSPAEVNQALHRGGALFSAKKFDEAEQIARLILKFLPRQADALHLLGLVLLAKGDAPEAERLMARALKLSGNHPVLLVNLGNAARAQGNMAKAQKYYERAQTLYPLHDDIYLERGILFNDARRFKDAFDDFKTLLELKPDSLEGYSGAAHAASMLGQFRLAIEYCEEALKHFSEPPIEMLAMIAVSLERLSELPEAIVAAERVLAIKPDHGSVLRVWAKAQRRLAKRDLGLLTTLRKRLEANDIEAMPDEDARVIYSELAQICEESGDEDAAFEYFRKQNDKTLQVAANLDLDRTIYRNEIDGLVEAYQPELLDSIRTTSERAENSSGREADRVPVFLVGFPRSGTTLLDQILDAHPDVQVIEEQPMVRKLRDGVEALTGGYPKALATLREGQRRKLRNLYWDEVEKNGGDFSKRVIVDKMPLSIVHVPAISAIFPNARIILALRHPADCSLSCFMQDFELNGAMLNFTSLEGVAHIYSQVMTLWARYEAHLSLNVRRVHYERLVADLRGEVEPALNFLGLDWDEAMGDPAAHAKARGTIRTPSYAQVTQPIYGSAADRWRRYEKFLAPVLPTLEKHIQYFGYSL